MLARQRVADRIAALRAGSWQAIQQASDRSRALVVEVRAEARQSLRAARAGSQVSLTGVLERAALDSRQAGALLERQRQEVAIGARRALLEARTRSQALLREVAGQGPEKTLARGFALVRDADGRTITRAAQAKSQQSIEITFSDGTLAARTRRTTGTQDP
jgi:exodeoxyribonuclease VII large subunit